MTEVVKSPAMIIIAIVVFLLIIFFMFEFIYGIKIGRAVCKYIGYLIADTIGGIITTALTRIGVDAACNLLFF